ncbi:hypothetical protein M1L60_24025 [Actinoplanes sp. TRM 88003]|uniref:DUF4386 family protein n=1 Tax=Paractinoplanes aksuensis TaxID=2939490 RepID=A0ABT1DS62_9ACTN|nr:hypothetical protein [Actinoplanes aksuensis]MCO8273668.1 hypothetical protein [Actinoplanes aksuensis]
MSISPYRTAGVAALVAAAAYLVQPVLVALGAGEESRMGTAAYLAERTWQGALGGVVFAAVGIALAVTVRAVAAATGYDGIGSWLGRLSAGAWVAVGGLSLAPYSSVGVGIDELTTDPTLQRVVAHTVDVVNTGFIAVAAIGFAGWVALLGAGKVLSRVGVVAALVVVVPILVWSQPWGVLVMIPYLLVLGVVCLRRARRPVEVR